MERVSFLTKEVDLLQHELARLSEKYDQQLSRYNERRNKTKNKLQKARLVVKYSLLWRLCYCVISGYRDGFLCLIKPPLEIITLLALLPAPPPAPPPPAPPTTSPMSIPPTPQSVLLLL